MKYLVCLLLALGTCLQAAVKPGYPEPLKSPDQVPEGLTKSDWQSIRAAYEAGRHGFHAVEGGWQARNPGQQWTTTFDGRGFTAAPRDGGWTWGLALESYGLGDHQRRIEHTTVARTAGQRLSYDWGANLEEWFINDQRGLEHGFTVRERPEADAAAPGASLDFVIAVRGTLNALVDGDARGVSFQDARGNTVLTYAGLKVWDADGRILESSFEPVSGNRVRLRVQEAGARYPLTIDPIAQQAYLKADSTGSSDYFGYSVAISGDTVLVGAYREDSSTTGVNSTPNEGATDSGAAYVFVRNGTAWTQQAYLKASNTGSRDFFGFSVALSGNTAVIGAHWEDSSTTGVNSTPDESTGNAGAAYVFVRSGTTWSQQAYLKASNTGIGDNFGTAVAISGDTIVVGSMNEDSSTTGSNSTPNESAVDSGAAYVFVRSGTTWTQQAYLKASNTGAGDFFSYSLGIEGDTIVVGAYSEDSSTTGVNSTSNNSATDSGAAYVFARSGTTWTQQAYLKAGNTGAGDFFGYSVGVSGDTVVVGAHLEDSGTSGVNSTPDEQLTNSGAAYVFFRSGTVWTQQAYLKAGNTGGGDRFGIAVAVSGDSIVVGAYEEDSGTTGSNSTPNETAFNSGAAYVFVRSGTTWSQQAYLKAGNTGAEDSFGLSVAISVDTVVVGAFLEDGSAVGVNGTSNESAANSGAAYFLVRSSGVWSQQAYAKASNTQQYSVADDNFGVSVAASGDTVVIGAPGEDSSTTTINGTPDEAAANSGAAFVFVRSGTVWSQQAFLKASNAGAGDAFGTSVAVSGDTIVVGAYLEDSSTTGVNTTPNDGAINAGAAYVFVRTGTTWSQQAYLKASNAGGSDSFGCSVALSGDTAVVGAYGEDSGSSGVNNSSNEAAGEAGAAYVFVRSGSIWSQQAFLKAGNPGAGDLFGWAVAISADTVIVGSPVENSSSSGVNGPPNEGTPSSGAAYVFVRSNGTWNQQAFIKASNPGASDGFGWAVSISNDTAVVGALQEDSSTPGVNGVPNESAADSGAAYVFVRSEGTWGQQAYLKASNPGAGDRFGACVGVSGDTVVVGARAEDSSTTGVSSTPDESAADAGAVYVFSRYGSTWSQQAYLKASNTGAGDQFGYAVAVSADTVIVGAPFEDSSSIGVNSTANESAANSGAAYVFLLAVAKPALVGASASEIGTTKVTLSSQVLFDGASPIVARGFLYAPTATNANPLLGGAGVINLTVAGTSGWFSEQVTGLTNGTTYTFKAYATNLAGTTYTAAGTFTTVSSDATLTNLVVSTGPLSPEFSSTKLYYDTWPPEATTSLRVTPTASSAFATIRVNGTVVASGSASVAIPLSLGTNTITVLVTAQDGTERIYSIAAMLPFPTLSSDAALSNLVVSPGLLSPEFSSARLNYDTWLPAPATSLTVTPTASSFSATIQVNGTIVYSGWTSADIPLSPGTNTITVLVTAQDGTTRTYTIDAVRSAAPVITSAATASGVVGTAFSYQITATASPTSYSAAPLPSGLSVNPSTGLISGTPTLSGTFTVNLSATNASGTGTQTLELSVIAAPPTRSFVQKLAEFRQTSAAAPSGPTYAYRAAIEGVGVPFATAPTLGLPAGAAPALRTFTYDAATTRYLVESEFTGDPSTAKQNLDQTYPNGDHTLTTGSSTLSLTFGTDAYPVAPTVSASAGRWVNGQLVLTSAEAAAGFTLTGSLTSANGPRSIEISSTAGTVLYFQQDNAAGGAPPATVSRAIPGALLTVGGPYLCEVEYDQVVDSDTTQAAVFGPGYAVNSAVTTVEILVVPSDPFTDYLSAAGVPAGQQGPTADPDGDGIPNLVEYALGASPMVASGSALPTIVVGTHPSTGKKHLLLTAKLNASATGITLVPEVSGDCSTWSSGASATETVSDTTANGVRTWVVRDVTPIETATPNRFARLRVVQP